MHNIIKTTETETKQVYKVKYFYYYYYCYDIGSKHKMKQSPRIPHNFKVERIRNTVQ